MSRPAFRTLSGILLAFSVAGCLSTRPSPLSIDSSTLRSLRGARCFALFGPEESLAVLRSELGKRLPDAKFVSADGADVIILFDGDHLMSCIDCDAGWRSPHRSGVASASIERQGCPAERSTPLLRSTWSNESYGIRGNARALVALLYPLLKEQPACSCSCGQRNYIYPNCGDEAGGPATRRPTTLSF
jgi:hypothetical protein